MQAQLRELTLHEENAAFEKAISDCEGKIQEKLQEAEQLRVKLEELDATLTTELQTEQSAPSDSELGESTGFSFISKAQISSLQESLDGKKKELASMEEIVQNLERQWTKVQEESLKQHSPVGDFSIVNIHGSTINTILPRN